MSGAVRVIRINHLRPPVVLAIAEAEEPPPLLTVSYPGNTKKAPPGTIQAKNQAIYINSSRLSDDLRKACVEYVKKDCAS